MSNASPNNIRGNHGSGNGTNGIQITGTLATDSTLNSTNLIQNGSDQTECLPYMTYGTITIPSGVTLTMEAGTVVKLSGINAKIQVDGTLNSNGTTEQPVHLTSLKDDSVWGDTNNDGTATSPAVGDWHMVCLNSDLTASTITNTRFCYGGNYGRSPFYVRP